MRLLYVLEFFREDMAEGMTRLKTFGHEAEAEPEAIVYARAFLNNVTIEDKRPTVCLLKNVSGKVLSVVAAPASAGEGSRPAPAIHVDQRD